MSIGENVRRLRKAAGMSQEELGKRADVTGEFISHIERNSKKLPLEKAGYIAAALGCKIDDFFTCNRK